MVGTPRRIVFLTEMLAKPEIDVDTGKIVDAPTSSPK